MTDYRAIMTLLIKQRSYRQIEQQLGCSHRVIARANHTLRTCGFSTVEQVAALTDNELDELFVDKRTTGQGEFVPIDFEKSLKPAQDVQSRPCKSYGHATPPPQPGRGSGTTATTGSANLSQHMSTRPGFQHASHTHQDTPCKSTGQAPRCDCLTQPGNRVQKSVSLSPLFHIQGCCLPVRVLTNANRPGLMLTGVHSNTSVVFCQVVVPDNASTASNAISTSDRNRKVNDTYEQFLEHYNTAALPARPRRPKDKANVEAAVKIVTHKIIHALDGHQCVDLDELNGKIVSLVDAINDVTPFRSQQSPPGPV